MVPQLFITVATENQRRSLKIICSCLLKPTEDGGISHDPVKIFAPHLEGNTLGILSVKPPPVMWASPFTPPLLIISSACFYFTKQLIKISVKL